MDDHPEQRLNIGRWRVDGNADEIEADGRVIKLEPQQMRLLLVLARRAGQVVLTQELLDEVWHDLIVTPNSVYQAVAQLRRQLGDTAAEPAYIQTVHRKGYRLVAPVSVATPARPAAAEPMPMAAPPAPGPAPAPAPSFATTAPAGQRRRWWLGAGASAAAALLVAVVAASYRGRPGAPGAVPRLAVLPFRDATAGAPDQALAQGLALDVIRQLGQHADLAVLAPDSVLRLPADVAASPLAQARELSASHLLLGNLRRQGPVLRLELRLLDADPPAERWRRDYEWPPAVVSQLPAAVAIDVAMALGLPALAARRSTPGPSEAYELYVLGENAWRPRTQEAFEKARGYFQRGIEADPAFARNHIGLAWSWIGQATNGAGLDLSQAVARATPLFERALALDPDAADALTGQALLYHFAGEFEAARRLLARALAIQPNDVQAHVTWGVVDFDDGWPARAAAHFERAVALSPLAPVPLERLGTAKLLAGQVDVAVQSFHRVRALAPRDPNGAWGLGMHGYAVGDLVQAVDGYRQALALEPRRPYLWQELAWLYLDLERPDQAEAAFARATEQLPGTDWLPVFTTFAWVAKADRGPPPPALAQTQAATDRGGVHADLCFVRAMAGLPVDSALLQRSLDVAQARGQRTLPITWFVFQGWHRLLNLATVQQVLGQAAAVAAALISVEQQLDALQEQGNRWPMLDFHRGRALALRGRPADALAALERATAAGSRRGWWLRLDPALAPLRGEPRWRQLLAGIDQRVADQRRRLGL